MGTYTEVLALRCSPDDVRKPTIGASAANYGTGPQRRLDYDRASPSAVLGRVLMGFEGERDAGWVTFEPGAVIEVRRDVLRAIANAERSKDEDERYFGTQLRRIDEVFEHAEQHQEWVVSVFEGNVACFLEGGRLDRRRDDPLFAPHCEKMYLASRSLPLQIPLGIAAILGPGLALAAWRARRLRTKRDG